jgi:hypothetical protein
MKSLLTLLACAWLSIAPGRGQNFYGSAFIGGANYQGEMQQISFAFNGMRPAGGLGAHLRLHDHLWLSTELMLGHLGGRDADLRVNSNNVARNLSFETRLQELSLQLRLNLLRGAKQPFVPYVTGGTAVFHIDPYAYDAGGQKHFLYPLSTEGQGLAAYPDRKTPSRLNLAIPLGAGLEFRMAGGMRIDLEILFRKSFTDYIDDVSKSYPDPDLLLAARGPVALDLSYRGDEMPGGRSSFPGGVQRGNPNRMDWYHSFNIRVKQALFEPRQRNTSRRYESTIACPRILF